MNTSSKPPACGEVHHLDEETTAEASTPRHAAQVDQQEPQRPGLHPFSDPLEQAARRAEEHEPVHAQDLDAVAHSRSSARAAGGRSTLLWYVSPKATSRTSSIRP